MIIHSRFMELLNTTPALTIYQGTVPTAPKFPYVLVSGSIPRVTERGLTRVPQGSVGRYRTTIVSLAEDSVRIVSGRVCKLLESRRFTAPGYVLGPVESVPDDLPIMEDLDVTLANNVHPLYTVIEWRFTVC